MSSKRRRVSNSKVLTAVADIICGIITIIIGLSMLPFQFAIIWVVFNGWVWLGAPITLLWANQKETSP